MKRVYVVYALICNQDKSQVLMVKNKDNNDIWSLPGGAVEENETLEQATIREVKEETGLIIKIINVAAINERIFESKNEIVTFITINAEIIGGEITINFPNEISEVKWVDISTADKLMPYHKEGIKKLINNSASYCFQDN